MLFQFMEQVQCVYRLHLRSKLETDRPVVSGTKISDTDAPNPFFKEQIMVFS